MERIVLFILWQKTAHSTAVTEQGSLLARSATKLSAIDQLIFCRNNHHNSKKMPSQHVKEFFVCLFSYMCWYNIYLKLVQISCEGSYIQYVMIPASSQKTLVPPCFWYEIKREICGTRWYGIVRYVHVLNQILIQLLFRKDLLHRYSTLIYFDWSMSYLIKVQQSYFAVIKTINVKL